MIYENDDEPLDLWVPYVQPNPGESNVQGFDATCFIIKAKVV